MTNTFFSIGELAQILDAQIIGDKTTLIDKLAIDSRTLGKDLGTLFFALKTSKNDGHKYINSLLKKGVVSFVVDKIPDGLESNGNFIIVNDTLKALQTLATYRRENSNLKVIGITGSNGKTVTKEWIYQLLKDDFKIVRSPKSYNSQIGVPLSVLGIDNHHDLGIFEAGISMPNEMQVLEQIINPQIGIFTNIGLAHSENFSSLEQKVKEKIILFKRAKKLLYKNDGLVGKLINESEILIGVQKLTWSFKAKSDLQILGVLKSHSSSKITGFYKSEISTITIPFTDDASIENAVVAWLLMLDLGYSTEIIANRMLHLQTVEMRLEQLEGNNNCTLINDVYNFDLNSLKIALDYLDTQFQHTKRTVILSSIEQSGVSPDELYNEVGKLILKYKIDKVVLVGDELTKYSNYFPFKSLFKFNNTSELLNNLTRIHFEDEVILVKGARSFEFETVVKQLAKKSHDTVLEINLSALVRNLNFFKSKLKSTTKLMVMVKAFSYGGGSYEIANILQYHNVDYLAVAYADEGKALRESGITIPILVLNPEVSSYKTLISYNLEPEIYSIRVLNEFLKVLGDNNYSIHLKIDTGMHRLGFRKEEVAKLISVLKNNKNIEVKSVFSHLSSADDLSESNITKKQAQYLQAVYSSICREINYKPLLHLLNSMGVVNYPEYQFDMVRVGLGLHGISFNTNAQQFLEPVTSLKTVISQVRIVNKGEGVGYNRKFKADKETIIATLPIGYADGIDRRWGNNIGDVVIGGTRAKIVGTIAMDMLMVDVSNVECAEGDEVEIFGKQIRVTEIAEKIETIPYEILTKISPRVKRIYYQE
jgi:alanine racemase